MSSQNSSPTPTCASAPRYPHLAVKRLVIDLHANNTLTWLCFSWPAEVPLGRRNQESFPQRSRERASWWLRGPRWVNPPTAPWRDQSPLSAFCYWTTTPFSVFLRALLSLSAWTNVTPQCPLYWLIKLMLLTSSHSHCPVFQSWPLLFLLDENANSSFHCC